ncbi:hypothetical protein MVLG_02532 [Microbotryum lychnidis-dioicae p1A1 Lamole]|uniref:Major facilitator superfamily (MFS) profile domain-containing protein n=1 Tax=Microbotryum lychnidis-dioicae (strain p1A1 Lamole / MvSl-1064) TaxID=683840 RepID=U5H5F9_USTV1|nr:hypothetical protein MVLG_02532 [Microbotryum lychnidis-dioicae p1A1 Lamole]|eukprot:KDE07127.1 hypothetical protein MVLG_02532 [Microbotryum lychnidis-dioicae p1A1 Lamole]
MSSSAAKQWVVRDDELDEATAQQQHVDAEVLHRLKHSADGHHILIPQPDDNPRNPLNWSEGKKWATLIAISFAATSPDYGSATGATTLIPQGIDWGLSPNYVNHSQAGNVFMLGAGGIFAVALSNVYGRLPVAFWMLGLSVIFAVLCAAAPDFKTFFAARILQGFFSAPCQATGLIIVRDIYFFHSQVRKVNIWSGFFILSPYVGPIISAAILSSNSENIKLWHWSFGSYSMLCALAFLGVVLFVDETWYNREIPERNQPLTGGRLARMTGIGRPKGSSTRYTLYEAWYRMFAALIKPPVLAVCISFGLNFAWVVGINTTLPIFLVPLYGFGDKQIALFYFTPVVATILGEAAAHVINPRIQEWTLKRNHGVWKPENRLIVNLMAYPFCLLGLVLIGFAFEHHYHYMLISLAWGIYVFSIMLSTAGYYQYLLDIYPTESGELAAWINFARVIGGFTVSYTIVDFVNSQGAIKAFGIFAGLSTIASLFVPALMYWGPSLRETYPSVGLSIPSKTASFVSSSASGEKDTSSMEKTEVHQIA